MPRTVVFMRDTLKMKEQVVREDLLYLMEHIMMDIGVTICKMEMVSKDSPMNLSMMVTSQLDRRQALEELNGLTIQDT